MTVLNKEFFKNLSDRVVKSVYGDRERTIDKLQIETAPDLHPVMVKFDYNEHTKLVKYTVTIDGNHLSTNCIHKDGGLRSRLPEWEDGIASCFFQAIADKEDFTQSLANLLEGTTANKTLHHPIGLSVKFHKDDDSQVLLVEYKGKSLYALEEAINLELGIGYECFTESEVLFERVSTVMCYLVDTGDYEFEYSFN